MGWVWQKKSHLVRMGMATGMSVRMRVSNSHPMIMILNDDPESVFHSIKFFFFCFFLAFFLAFFCGFFWYFFLFLYFFFQFFISFFLFINSTF